MIKIHISNKNKNLIIKSLQLSVVIVMLSALLACNSQETSNDHPIFIDVAEKSGIKMTHQNGMSGQLYYPEIMGASVALFDIEGDGDLDIYFGQGGSFDHSEHDSSSRRGKLYRNDSEPGQFNFTDVTESSGLWSDKYAMGIATGDVNNDGYVDVFLSNFDSNQLFINQGNGTFQESQQSILSDDVLFSSSSAFVDVNADGWLDLYVTQYVDYQISEHETCYNDAGEHEYCGPASYQPLTDQLFINTGNGIFRDESKERGINSAAAGLGVVTADFNSDGLIDIYVANDQSHNFLWINQGDGYFINEALFRGNAVNHHGRAEASMGVDVGDLDNDGDFDLFMTHLLNETNTLYLNDGHGYFSDMTSSTGMADPSMGLTGFGTAFFDYDNDGWLDALVANGAVRRIKNQVKAGLELPLEQPNLLVRNKNGQFTDTTHLAPILSVPAVSRALAVGDLDNDGDTDVVITNNNNKPNILMNQVGQNSNWLGLSLIHKNGRSDLGATATLTRPDGLTMRRRVRTDASYLAANDPRIIFGLKNSTQAVNVEVQWSDGQLSNFTGLELNTYHTLQQKP